jgi:hypothetical protein
LQRARWALDQAELDSLKERAESFGLNESESFPEFKEKYTEVVENPAENAIIKSEEKIVYRECSTIAEAEQFAREEAGIQNTSYRGLDISVANAMNESLTNALNYCPELRDKLKFYGSAQERNKAMKKDLTTVFEQWLSGLGFPQESVQKLGKQYASKFVRRIDSNTYAIAYSGKLNGDTTIDGLLDVLQKYTGIGVNANIGKDYDSMLASVKRDVSSGWHPQGCDTVRSIFDHEFGHLLDYNYGIRDEETVQELFNGMTATEIGKSVSRYGATNIAEFIAESYSEFVNSTSPRQIANTIGGIIEKKVSGV